MAEPGGDTIEAVYFNGQGFTATAIPTGFTLTRLIGVIWSSAYQTGVAAGAQNPTFTTGTGGSDAYVLGGGFVQTVVAGLSPIPGC
jgi:hypothetical protein